MTSQTVQAFQLGSSTVVTLPKELGIKPGQKFSVKKTSKQITLKEEQLSKEEIHKLVEKLAGGLKLKKDLTPAQLRKLFETSYEKKLLS